MNKICYIFLDIDGVLNDINYIMKCYERHNKPMHMNHVPFNPKSLNVLMELCQSIEKNGYEVRIILSSTWRLHEIDTEIVKARIAEYGLSLYGKTSYISGDRGKEIQDYLKDKENYKFIILDDDKFDIENIYPNNLIYVKRQYGLSISDKNKALKIILKKEVKNE